MQLMYSIRIMLVTFLVKAKGHVQERAAKEGSDVQLMYFVVLMLALSFFVKASDDLQERAAEEASDEAFV
jgi:hypothetical protein